jgi:hypothetical protein
MAPKAKKQSKKKRTTSINGRGLPPDKRATKPSGVDKAKKATGKATAPTAVGEGSPEQDEEMGVPGGTEAEVTTGFLKMGGQDFSL